MTKEVSLYIHIPFCKHRCSYCDFNTYAGQEKWIPDYIAALQSEIAQVSGKAGVPPLDIHTIFLGGGTPSLIPTELLADLMQTVRTNFNVQADAEITLEANPGTLTLNALQSLRKIGFNRLSMGMQSAVPEELTMLERQHTTMDVIEVVQWARKAGFDNLNLDLIFGIPGQTLHSWRNSLETVLRLRPEHLSLYSLTVEHGTPFLHWVRKGLVQMPDDDLAADMYDLACEELDSGGYTHYEISNWALTRRGEPLECRHNLQYWRNLPYVGAGAGAHGYVAGVRTTNLRGIRAYVDYCQRETLLPFPAGPACQQTLPIDDWTAMQEHMMVGLRLLVEGVNREEFNLRFGVELTQVFGKQIDQQIQRGLLEWAGADERTLRLTHTGWLLGNSVFREFVDLPDPRLAS